MCFGLKSLDINAQTFSIVLRKNPLSCCGKSDLLSCFPVNLLVFLLLFCIVIIVYFQTFNNAEFDIICINFLIFVCA